MLLAPNQHPPFSLIGCKDTCSCWVGWCARKDQNLRGRRERNFSTRSARRRLRELLCSPQIHSPLGPFLHRVESWTGRKYIDGHGLRLTGRQKYYLPPNSRHERCRRARSRNFCRKCRRETNNSRTPRGYVALSFGRRGMVIRWVGEIILRAGTLRSKG